MGQAQTGGGGTRRTGQAASLNPGPGGVAPRMPGPGPTGPDLPGRSRPGPSRPGRVRPAQVLSRSPSRPSGDAVSSSTTCTAASSAPAAPASMPTSSATASFVLSVRTPSSGATRRPARSVPVSGSTGSPSPPGGVPHAVPAGHGGVGHFLGQPLVQALALVLFGGRGAVPGHAERLLRRGVALVQDVVIGPFVDGVLPVEGRGVLLLLVASGGLVHVVRHRIGAHGVLPGRVVSARSSRVSGSRFPL